MMVFYPTIIPDYPNQQPPEKIRQAFMSYIIINSPEREERFRKLFSDPSRDTVCSVEPPQHPDPINPDWLDEPDTGEEEEE